MVISEGVGDDDISGDSWIINCFIKYLYINKI
jgi:hypothetical protein